MDTVGLKKESEPCSSVPFMEILTTIKQEKEEDDDMEDNISIACLKQNLSSSSDSEIFKCDVCEEKFLFANDLEVHRIKHETGTLIDSPIKTKATIKDEQVTPKSKKKSNKNSNKDLKMNQDEHFEVESHTEIIIKQESSDSEECSSLENVEAGLAGMSQGEGGSENNQNNRLATMKSYYKQSKEQVKTKNQKINMFCYMCSNFKKLTNAQWKNHLKKHEQEINNDTMTTEVETAEYFCHECKNYDVKMTKMELVEHYRISHEAQLMNMKKRFFRRARSRRPRSPRPDVFRCEICSEEFGSQVYLEDHMKSHNNQYSCDICEEGFKKLIDYAYHMQIHSEDKLFKCPLCEFNTDKGYLLRTHLYSVHEQFKKYKCDLCNKGFAIFTHFQEHKYYHTGEKPFTCDICNQKFMYTRYLNSHKVQMHKEGGQKGIECKLCNKVYSHRNSLNTHMKSHSGEKCVCDVCGKQFSSNEKLRLHYRIHTGEKPYKCEFCEKTFVKNSYKIEHERIHTGEKPYECPYCGKGFSQRSSMVIHSRGHTGEKPYSCHLCSKGFAARSMLTIHLKSCRGIVMNSSDED